MIQCQVSSRLWYEKIGYKYLSAPNSSIRWKKNKSFFLWRKIRLLQYIKKSLRWGFITLGNSGLCKVLSFISNWQCLSYDIIAAFASSVFWLQPSKGSLWGNPLSTPRYNRNDPTFFVVINTGFCAKSIGLGIPVPSGIFKKMPNEGCLVFMNNKYFNSSWYHLYIRYKLISAYVREKFGENFQKSHFLV